MKLIFYTSVDIFTVYSGISTFRVCIQVVPLLILLWSLNLPVSFIIRLQSHHHCPGFLLYRLFPYWGLPIRMFSSNIQSLNHDSNFVLTLYFRIKTSHRPDTHLMIYRDLNKFDVNVYKD